MMSLHYSGYIEQISKILEIINFLGLIIALKSRAKTIAEGLPGNYITNGSEYRFCKPERKHLFILTFESSSHSDSFYFSKIGTRSACTQKYIEVTTCDLV